MARRCCQWLRWMWERTRPCLICVRVQAEKRSQSCKLNCQVKDAFSHFFLIVQSFFSPLKKWIDLLVCRDLSFSRLDRLERTLKSYLPSDILEKKVRIEINQEPRVDKEEEQQFDCVLVDAPCTNDRLSLNENNNNIFSMSRYNERSEIPKKQADLLMYTHHALQFRFS